MILVKYKDSLAAYAFDEETNMYNKHLHTFDGLSPSKVSQEVKNNKV